MNQLKVIDFISQNVSALNNVGKRTTQLLKKKNIEKISDLLWSLPQGFTDRSDLKTLKNLEIGKIATIKLRVVKYNFPRIRNLPSKVACEDRMGKIDIVFFNSREGYVRKILPLNSTVVVSGKINFFKKKYQIVNPTYVVPLDREDYVKKIIPKYALTEGLTEKVYRKLIEQVLEKIRDIAEWHDKDILKKIGNISWYKSLMEMHRGNNSDLNTNSHRRLAYDEILANRLVLSEVRKKVRRYKKKNKQFNNLLSDKIRKNFNFPLTSNQIKIINEIDNDLKSNFKMFRLIQGDVGSGKTIICFIAAANVINSKYQVALMAPTEILAKQHYNLAKKVFKYTNTNIELLSSKTEARDKKIIIKNLVEGKINFIIGTHSLFQKNIIFKSLGLVIIDEQHKFGVKQRIELSQKGGRDCDILLMSATPIPRSLMLTIYGDMDISRLIEKPLNRKEISTISKPEEKMSEVINFIKKQFILGKQIFWVCPLIEESKKLDYTAAVKKYNHLSKLFKGKVGLVHGSLEKKEKDKVINNFIKKNISILVSTTVIEVGIDFPNANIIVIENSNKFGLSQLHQLRGRVGRDSAQGICILLYKKNLTENAKRRIKILKSSNDGFLIAEEDMKLRGYGDVLGYQQSGIKNFKIADPIHHEDLFKIAEQDIKNIEEENNLKKYDHLLKLFDKADIINQINLENSI